MKYVVWYLVLVAIELLLEVVSYVVEGKHNWAAIGFAIMFSIFAIILYYDDRKE